MEETTTEDKHDVCVLWGSSRPDGNTRKTIDVLIKKHHACVIDVGAADISPYDYEHKNKDDAFLEICEIIQKSNSLVFCTPVYWYAMSAHMKIFFDRLSDLISIRKDIGRSLVGKHVFMMANGTEERLPAGFEEPFRRTSEYFDMIYQGHHYVHTGKNENLKVNTWADIDKFSQLIFGYKK